MKIKIIDDDIQFMDSLKNTLTGEFDNVLMDSSTSFEDEYDYDIYFLDILTHLLYFHLIFVVHYLPIYLYIHI